METQQLDIIKIMWEAGIIVKLVLLLLLWGSVYSWSAILKKKKQIKEARDQNENFLNIYYASNNLKEVMTKCESLPFSPYKTMFTHGHNELMKIRANISDEHVAKHLECHFQKFGLGVIERALHKGVNEVNSKLDKLLSTLASIGAITPFVGLFGTVWGIIDSFSGIAGGGATLDAVAPGIAEALVATAIGLVVAIPAVWFYNHFTSENSKINSEMESFGQEFLNVVERSLVSND